MVGALDPAAIDAAERIVGVLDPEEADMAAVHLETYLRDPEAARGEASAAQFGGIGAEFGSVGAELSAAAQAALAFFPEFLSASKTMAPRIVEVLQWGASSVAAVVTLISYRDDRRARAEKKVEGEMASASASEDERAKAAALLEAMEVRLREQGVDPAVIEAHLRPSLAALLTEPASAKALLKVLTGAGER